VDAYPNSPRLIAALDAHHRHSERAIAVLQAIIVAIVIGFHLVSALRNSFATFGVSTLSIALALLASCALRWTLSHQAKIRARLLHALTIADGMLLIALILSYTSAYLLPLGTTFKAPSVAFLFLFIGIRAVRFDPEHAVVAGLTVMSGWIGIVIIVATTGEGVTHSYQEYVTSGSILIGAAVEILAALAGMTLTVAFAARHAGRMLENSAHAGDLAAAKARAEDALAARDAIFRSSVDGIVTVNASGVVVSVNPAAEEMFGYSEAELSGRSVACLMSPENAMKLGQAVVLYLQTGESHLVGKVYESEGVRRNGEHFVLDISISAYRLGGETLFTAMVRDATVRRAAEESERRANARFEEAVTAALDAVVFHPEVSRFGG
jgi:PAS domain S-box-containing protein